MRTFEKLCRALVNNSQERNNEEGCKSQNIIEKYFIPLFCNFALMIFISVLRFITFNDQELLQSTASIYSSAEAWKKNIPNPFTRKEKVLFCSATALEISW